MRKRWLVVAAAVSLVALAFSGQAFAQVSAVDQYVEDIPTSEGSTVTGAGGGSGGGRPSAAVNTQIQKEGGEDAPLLQEVVSSPNYGAPSKKLAPGRTDRTARERGPNRGYAGELPNAATPDDPSPGSAVSAAVSAVQGGDSARLIGLLVGMLAIATVALAAAALRHRRRSAS